MRVLVNMGDVTQYIRVDMPAHTKTWMKTTFIKYMINKFEPFVEEEIPQDMSGELLRRVAMGARVGRIVISPDKHDEISHMVDYVQTHNLNLPDYLRLPNDLRGISFDVMVTRSKQWSKWLARTQVSRINKNKLGDDAKVLATFGKYHLVEIITPASLKLEGKLMSHCVGGAYYVDQLKRGTSRFFSIRDEENVSHVTMDMADGVISQVQGVNDHSPASRYIDAIVKSVELLGAKMSNLAVHKINLIRGDSGKLFDHKLHLAAEMDDVGEFSRLIDEGYGEVINKRPSGMGSDNVIELAIGKRVFDIIKQHNYRIQIDITDVLIDRVLLLSDADKKYLIDNVDGLAPRMYERQLVKIIETNDIAALKEFMSANDIERSSLITTFRYTRTYNKCYRISDEMSDFILVDPDMNAPTGQPYTMMRKMLTTMLVINRARAVRLIKQSTHSIESLLIATLRSIPIGDYYLPFVLAHGMDSPANHFSELLFSLCDELKINPLDIKELSNMVYDQVYAGNETALNLINPHGLIIDDAPSYMPNETFKKLLEGGARFTNIEFLTRGKIECAGIELVKRAFIKGRTKNLKYMIGGVHATLMYAKLLGLRINNNLVRDMFYRALGSLSEETLKELRAMLLERGIDIKDDHGDTLLSRLIKAYHVTSEHINNGPVANRFYKEIVWLLKNGANPNELNYSAKDQSMTPASSPIHSAFKVPTDPRVIKALIKHGADVNLKSKAGVVAWSKFVNMVRLSSGDKHRPGTIDRIMATAKIITKLIDRSYTVKPVTTKGWKMEVMRILKLV